MAKEKYNWEEIIKELESGSTYKEQIDKHGMALATISRKYNAYLAGKSKGMEDSVVDYELEVIAQKQLKILKEQKKNTIIRSEANKATKDLAILDIIAEALENADIKPYKPKRYVSNKIVLEDRTQKFIVSDLHYVDEYRSASLNKMGKMWLDNWDGSKTIEIIFNGDLIENTHHVSQLLDRDSENPTIQAINVGDIISKQLAYLMDNIPEDVLVIVEWIYGNHDEIRQLTKAGETRDSNWVWVVREIVNRALSNYIPEDPELYGEQGFHPCGCGVVEEHLTCFDYKANGLIIHEADEDGYKHEETVYHKWNEISIRHGHHLKGNRQEQIEQYLIKESVQGDGLKSMYIISHFHQFRHWVMKGSNIDGYDCEVVMTPAMKDWNGDFENDNNTRNTSGMISIDQDRNVKFIRIPKDA